MHERTDNWIALYIRPDLCRSIVASAHQRRRTDRRKCALHGQVVDHSTAARSTPTMCATDAMAWTAPGVDMCVHGLTIASACASQLFSAGARGGGALRKSQRRRRTTRATGVGGRTGDDV